MQSSFRSWMLPEGVIEALPEDAEKLNDLSQRALSLFARWGYQPLRPPLLEYADTFVGHQRSDDLVEQTIQFKDQMSGQQIALRADFTPQIARIDAHYLPTDAVARYVYSGEVVRSYPTNQGVRNPTIIGVELLGSASEQADIEIVSLLMTYLSALQLPQLTVSLGNVDIVVALLESSGVDESQFSLFFDSLAVKDTDRITTLCHRNGVDDTACEQLQALTTLYGDIGILSQAQAIFAQQDAVLRNIQRLQGIADTLTRKHEQVDFHIDLANVHGYGYHNGLVFSAYVEGIWQAVARGGRYDGFGNGFSESQRIRPSIGFSCQLDLLTALIDSTHSAQRVIVCDLPLDADEDLSHFITECRAAGDTVIQLFNDGSGTNRHPTHQVVKTAKGFDLIAL